MPSDEIFDKLKLFNSFIRDRARSGQVSSALALKKEHLAHIKEALASGDITQEQCDGLLGELEIMGDEEVKKCPRCDTAVRGNAKVCFKCGFAFEELVSPDKEKPFFEVPLPQAKPKEAYRPASSRKYLVLGVVAFVLIISLGIFAALLVRGVIPTFAELKQKISPQETYPPFVPPVGTAPPETPPPTAPPPPIAISKIQATAPDVSQEYIEIYNTTGAALEITGWTITDNQNNTYTFGKFFLQPGRRVKICTGSGSDTLVSLYWGLQKFVWDDSGDTITIRDASGNLVIQVSY